VVPAEPLSGATSPITLAGTLVVECVDTLSGVMLTQLVNPGTPVLFGCVSSITDLKDMKYLAGAIEMGLINAGASQMAQFYKLPIYATAGMSDAKVNDAQSGYESAMTSLLVALAGGNFIHDAAGFLEFCMTASFDKLVIDNEIIGMIMRALEGIQVNDQTLAFDELKKVGPAGHFVSSRHTRRHMRTEQYFTHFSDRENRAVWEKQGKREARQRATEIVKGILNQPLNPRIPEDLRARIKTDIPGLRSFIMD
jgi:trimethylamine--corrinoid protein Co-methyltransferase